MSRNKYEWFSETELTRQGYNFMFEIYPDSFDYNCFNTLNTIQELASNVNHPLKEYAYILHDKDNVKPHYHVCIKYRNPTRIKSVLNALNLEHYNPNNTDMIISKNHWTEALNYLIHNTKGCEDKHHYSEDEVISNIPDVINNLRTIIDEIDIFNEIAQFIDEGYNPTYQNVVKFCNSKGRAYMRCFLKRSNSFLFSEMIKERKERF